MTILSSVPLGVYAMVKDTGAPATTLIFLYAKGTFSSLQRVSVLRANLVNYASYFALKLQAVVSAFPSSELLALKVSFDSHADLLSALSDLHLTPQDVAVVTSREVNTLLGGVTKKVRKMTGSFSYFADVVSWFNAERSKFNLFSLTPNCAIDTAPSQFKVIYVDGRPVCYWNTRTEFSDKLRSKVDVRSSGIIINTFTTKQVLTLEMTRHKFVEVGERLVLDFKSGVCMREVGLVDSARTMHTHYQCIFDTTVNAWVVNQNSIEKTKILGMRSVDV